MIQKYYKPLKSIKKQTKFMDYYFMGKYSFSPYMACQHACKYCDGRAEKYYVEGDFEKDICIRSNVADLLDQMLGKTREIGTVLIGSGVSDPYQPVESSEGLMTDALHVILKHGFPVSVMTKSTLAMRDIDLYEAINNKTRALLMVSMVYANDKHRKIFEPYASTIDSRFKMIQAFKERGIPVCVLAMPLLPGISDSMEDVKELFDSLKALDVDVIMPGGLTLRPGTQKNTYMDIITEHYPELDSLYKKIYAGNYPSGSPERWYTSTIMPPIYDYLSRLQIPSYLPHKIYKGSYPKYDEIYFLLKHMKSLYKYRQIDIKPLKTADENYKKWYSNEKAIFNRKRSMTQEDLENILRQELYKENTLLLNGNKKLIAFMKEAVFGPKVFDYGTLKLIDP